SPPLAAVHQLSIPSCPEALNASGSRRACRSAISQCLSAPGLPASGAERRCTLPYASRHLLAELFPLLVEEIKVHFLDEIRLGDRDADTVVDHQVGERLAVDEDDLLG